MPMDQPDIFSEITSGKGFVVQKICDFEAIERLRTKLIGTLSKFSDLRSIEDLRNDICSMTNQQVNRIMIDLLGFREASELMLCACKAHVLSLCGPQVFLQRRANIIFNIPGEDQRHQWPHYELMSGISPFTFVLWAPLHDIDDGSGLFYLNSEESLFFMENEIKRGLVNSPYLYDNLGARTAVKVNYGEVIIFNPFIIHGNVPFQGTRGRIACSIRVQNAMKPLMQRNTDFFKYITIV